MILVDVLLIDNRKATLVLRREEGEGRSLCHEIGFRDQEELRGCKHEIPFWGESGLYPWLFEYRTDPLSSTVQM